MEARQRQNCDKARGAYLRDRKASPRTFFEQLLHSDAVQSRVGGAVPVSARNVLSKSLKLFDLKNARPDFKLTQRVKLGMYWGENHHEF